MTEDNSDTNQERTLEGLNLPDDSTDLIEETSLPVRNKIVAALNKGELDTAAENIRLKIEELTRIHHIKSVFIFKLYRGRRGRSMRRRIGWSDMQWDIVQRVRKEGVNRLSSSQIYDKYSGEIDFTPELKHAFLRNLETGDVVYARRILDEYDQEEHRRNRYQYCVQ